MKRTLLLTIGLFCFFLSANASTYGNWISSRYSNIEYRIMQDKLPFKKSCELFIEIKNNNNSIAFVTFDAISADYSRINKKQKIEANSTYKNLYLGDAFTCNGIQINFSEVSLNGVKIAPSSSTNNAANSSTICDWNSSLSCVTTSVLYGVTNGDPESIKVICENNCTNNLIIYFMIQRLDGTWAGDVSWGEVEPNKTSFKTMDKSTGQYKVFAMSYDYFKNNHCGYPDLPKDKTIIIAPKTSSPNICNWQSANNCLSIETHQGTRCGSSNSIELDIKNNCNTNVKIAYALEDVDGHWRTGLDGEFNEGTSPGVVKNFYTCNSTGRYYVFSMPINDYVKNSCKTPDEQYIINSSNKSSTNSNPSNSTSLPNANYYENNPKPNNLESGGTLLTPSKGCLPIGIRKK